MLPVVAGCAAESHTPVAHYDAIALGGYPFCLDRASLGSVNEAVLEGGQVAAQRAARETPGCALTVEGEEVVILEQRELPASEERLARLAALTEAGLGRPVRVRFARSGREAWVGVLALVGGPQSSDSDPHVLEAGPTAAADSSLLNPASGFESGSGAVPAWMRIEANSRRVSLEITAGATEANGHWNYNGFAHGRAELVVPLGYEVRVNFRNRDPLSAHSFGIERLRSEFPAVWEDPSSVFRGAISTHPTSLEKATPTGGSEALAFVAGEVGEFAIVCYVPGRAIAGMWLRFTVVPSQPWRRWEVPTLVVDLS